MLISNTAWIIIQHEKKKDLTKENKKKDISIEIETVQHFCKVILADLCLGLSVKG